ncbi:hypothetical protein L7F22_052626 [Adiantum nelumboides]|nr:hypothetical protein [Adiantum nelumboides]
MDSAAEASTSRQSETDRVQISIVEGDAFVWSTEWIARLRREHGIVGMLTGSLPLIPQQNVFLGIPLQLFEEEVVYLMRKGIAVLVDDKAAHSALHDSLTKEELQSWHESRRRAIEESKQKLHESAKQSKERWQQAAAGKEKAVERRKEREQRRERIRKERMEEGDGDKEDDNSGLFAPNLDSSNEDDSAQKTTTDDAWKTISHPITIATNSLELPWRIVKVGENAFETLSSAVKAGLWTYPNTPMQAARCATFEDLRSRGYFMAKGLRFGGDLNVYPGDLLRYHSHFTATIQCKSEQYIPAQELVSAGRLGTAVKKAHLLCTVTLNASDQDENQIRQARLEGKDDIASTNSWGSVDYFSLTWAGFGT